MIQKILNADEVSQILTKYLRDKGDLPADTDVKTTVYSQQRNGVAIFVYEKKLPK